jgi:streptogrisin D
LRRSALFRHAGAIVVAAGLPAAFLAVSGPPAAAAPIADYAEAASVVADLGEQRTGGVYYDENGALVITVTDRAAADTVTRAGGTPRLVTYSAAALQSVHTALDERIAAIDPISGSSWGVDPSTNTVVVEVDSTVQGADLARLRAALADYGDAVRLDRIDGVLKTKGSMPGGVGIHENNASGGRICTGGFNAADSSGARYLITAGHCVIGGKYWWERYYGGEYLGKAVHHRFGGKDFAVIKYLNSNVTAPGIVKVNGSDQQITTSRYAYDGEPVKRVGTSSSDLVGEVLVPSTTVTIDGVVLTDMIKTSLCALGGDSGGPLFRGTTALGVLSGGTDETVCNSGVSNRRNYFTPVQYVLSEHNLHVF